MIIIGTCSECDGPVVIPEVWAGLTPPIPTCNNCGAKAKSRYGPKIPMKKKGKVIENYINSLTSDFTIESYMNSYKNNY